MTRKNDKVVATIRRRKIEAMGVVILYFFIWLLINGLILRTTLFIKEFSVLCIILVNCLFFYLTVYKYLFFKCDLILAVRSYGGTRLKRFFDCPKLWNAYFSVAQNNNRKIWLCASDNRKYDACNVAVNYSQPIAMIISRGIIEDFSEKEIATIIGHELGHKRLWTIIELFRLFFELVIIKSISFYIVVWSASLFVENIVLSPNKLCAFLQISIFCLLCLFIRSTILNAWIIICMFLKGYYSRTLEYLADIHAVEVTGDPEVYATALKKLCKEDIIQLFFVQGPRMAFNQYCFRYIRTHPPMAMRISELKRLYDF